MNLFGAAARRRTTVLMILCAVFLVGLVAARFGIRVPLWPLVSVGLAAFLLTKKPVLRLGLLVVAVFGLGLYRGGEYYAQLKPYRDYAMEKATVRVTALEDAVYSDNGQLEFRAGQVEFIEPQRASAKGTMKIKGYGELAVYRGDRLEVAGKLYPTRGLSQASIGYGQMKRVGGQGSVVDDFRRRLGAGMQTALPEPLASFGMGLLIGQRATLPDDVTMDLKMVGLTHIIAVSGYNLTILLEAAKRVVGKRSKLLTTLSALGMMALFLLLTGASASIVRAAVVGILGLLAWYYGRNVRPVLLVLFAAALTAGWNPVYLWSDIGWYLSFLAFFGILVLAPQIFRRVWRDKKPPVLIAMAVETMCAEIMTIPLVMMIFGQVSLIGLAANMLVAIVVPLAMFFCFVASVAGMIIPLFSGWFSWPARLLLDYMLDTAHLLARLPHVFQTGRYLGVVDMILCYAALVLAAVALYRPRELSWLKHLQSIKPVQPGIRWPK